MVVTGDQGLFSGDVSRLIADFCLDVPVVVPLEACRFKLRCSSLSLSLSEYRVSASF